MSDLNNVTATESQQIHPAFELLRSERIASLNITMEEFRHRKTGAMHYHMASGNDENVFLVGLRTVPMDSTGVAHILEHTALCGSKKYPVRDPFFMMIRRSLNTFMNAFTSSDWTAYPFASKNRKDFNNLLQVYLDAVFFSRLHELDFAQEGHRLEFSDAEDSSSELEFKGVVFNEMKGAMSSTNSVLWQTVSKYLFPTNTYHFNSGGEPADIPDLSYQQLVDFYQTHYHPSNAVFMTFGDIPVYEHHQLFEELALKEFDFLDVNIAVTDEKRYLAPIKVEEFYESDETENKTHVVMGWLLGKSTSLAELFSGQLLANVLMDNSASPLLQVLETSNLGSAPSPMCGLEDSNKEMTFLAGLEGCADGSTSNVEALILDTLQDIVTNGVAQEQLEAALHQLELSQREISGDGYPYGLQLILTGLSTATHRGDPISLLHIDSVLEQLREDIKAPDYIPQLIQSLLLDNPHRVTLTMRPDSELASRKQAAEKARLASIRAALNDEQCQQIVDQAKALAKRQAAEDDVNLLPKVTLDDVPSSLHEPQANILQNQYGDDVSFYAQGTNGLSYQQIVVELPQLNEELLAVLPLFTSCFAELGVGEQSYTQLQLRQSEICGGINCFSSIRSNKNDEQQSKALVIFSSKALRQNHSAMSALLTETFTQCRFDETQRIRELIEQMLARKEASITAQGHMLAMGVASAGMNPTARLSHDTGGLAGIKRLKALVASFEDPQALTALSEKFTEIHRLILAAPRQFLLIGEAVHEAALCQNVLEAELPHSKTSTQPLALEPIRTSVKEAWATATQVNFCAKAYPTVPADHPDNAALSVLGGYLRNSFLHTAIREQGGAYGGGAMQDSSTASFRFFSYRDPRLQETLDDFDKSIQWMLEAEHPDHLLEEAILGVISAMDKPSSPAGEAKQAFYNRLFDRELAFRMLFRQRVLAVTLEDLRRVTRSYLESERASIGIVSNKENLSSATIEGLNINYL